MILMEHRLSSLRRTSLHSFLPYIWETPWRGAVCLTCGFGLSSEPLLASPFPPHPPLASYGSILPGCLSGVNWPDTLYKQLLCVFCSHFFRCWRCSSTSSCFSHFQSVTFTRETSPRLMTPVPTTAWGIATPWFSVSFYLTFLFVGFSMNLT